MKPVALTHGLPRSLTGYLFAILIAVLSVGCGGGGGDGNSAVSQIGKLFFVTARVGPIVAVRVGQTAILSGSSSDTSSTQPLTFDWSFSYKPQGSAAVLTGPTSADPSFVADVKGSYMVQLVVTAEGVSSKRAIQLVVATVAPERATGPANHAGLSSSCSNCHNDNFNTILSKVGNHAATSNNCEACHTPLGFAPVPYVDHQEVIGNCSQCHDGPNAIAVTKSEFHQQTNAECDDCHNTVSFLPLGPDGKYDHSGISRACSSCHNGTVALGPDNTLFDHKTTASDCGNCHSTDSFAGAYPDHKADPNVLTNRCDFCHNSDPNRLYPGRPPTALHPVTSPTLDCTDCHGIVTFNLGGVFNHRIDPTVLTCETCHNDNNSINARGKASAPNPHLSTVLGCNLCHNTTSFANAFLDHTLPIVTANRCDFCHGATQTVAPAQINSPALGKHANHMPTTDDCAVCHSPGGTFTTGTFDHAGVSSGCESCHDGAISVGMLPNHFPTNVITPVPVCADCHFDALATPTVFFVGATFDHVGIAGNNCESCHNGTFTTTTNTLYGKPTSHIPTSQDCNVCHTTTIVTAPFKPASNFNHTGITANCESCHNGNPDYVAVGAIGKKVNHIPALNDCVRCHGVNTSPGGFASPATFLANVHSGITSGCAGCHISKFLPPQLVKNANHLPTGQDCDLCHTATVAGFKPSTFAHVGITGNCASCHDGSANFVALGARGKAQAPNHPVTTTDCGVCHNTINFAQVFDHTGRTSNCAECHGDGAPGAVTKKNPGHVPTTQDCSVCHVPGTFANAIFNHTGIVNNCASCHDGIIATGKDAKPNPPGHIPTSQDCSVCHVPTAFAQANFNHQNIVDNCVICHDGIIVLGKHNNHVPTNEDCAVCHQTTGFIPATFSHAGIVDNCASCHDAGFATPKKTNHVPTNQDCGVCHNPGAFVPATFDHTGIVSGCATCHDGSIAKGMVDAVPAHLPTSLDCHLCHTTATFVGGTWVHEIATTKGICKSCHEVTGGVAVAPQKSPTHLPTIEQCDVCHSTNGWAPTIFSHSPTGNYPGDHRRDPGCTGCHKGLIGSGINIGNYPNQLVYAPFCAGCHAKDFRRKDKHIGGKNGTVAQNKDCSGGGRGCHRVSDGGFD